MAAYKITYKLFLITLMLLLNANLSFASATSLSVSTPSWAYLGEPDAIKGVYLASFALAPDSTPFLAYSIPHDGRAVVVKYDLKMHQWQTVGNQNHPSLDINEDIAVSPKGELYLSYISSSSPNDLVVEKYDNASQQWISLGNTGVVAKRTSGMKIGIDPSGVVYVVYQDNNQEDYADISVIRYNNKEWQHQVVYPHAFYTNPKIAIAKSGQVYISFLDDSINSDNSNLRVFTFDGSWHPITAPAFPTGRIYSFDSQIDDNDVLYIGYQIDFYISVIKLSGSKWELVGQDSFAFASPMWNDFALALDHNNNPWVAFQGMSPQASVMKYDSNTLRWINYGSPIGPLDSLDMGTILLKISPSNKAYLTMTRSTKDNIDMISVLNTED